MQGSFFGLSGRLPCRARRRGCPARLQLRTERPGILFGVRAPYWLVKSTYGNTGSQRDQADGTSGGPYWLVKSRPSHTGGV